MLGLLIKAFQPPGFQGVGMEKLCAVAIVVWLSMATNASAQFPVGTPEAPSGQCGSLGYLPDAVGYDAATGNDVCKRRGSQTTRRASTPHLSQTLSTVLINCKEGGPIQCDNDVYKKVWMRLEDTTGEITKIDMNYIQRNPQGAAMILVYNYVPNAAFDPTHMRRLFFDCKGHFSDITYGASAVLDAAPKSVAGQIASVACST